MKNQFSKLNYDLFQIKELNITDIFVYGLIESLTNNKKNCCFASNKHIVDLTEGKICIRTLQRSLRNLEKANLITVDLKRFNKSEGIKAERKIYLSDPMTLSHPLHDFKSPPTCHTVTPDVTLSHPLHDSVAHIIDNLIDNKKDKEIDYGNRDFLTKEEITDLIQADNLSPLQKFYSEEFEYLERKNFNKVVTDPQQRKIFLYSTLTIGRTFVESNFIQIAKLKTFPEVDSLFKSILQNIPTTVEALSDSNLEDY